MPHMFRASASAARRPHRPSTSPPWPCAQRARIRTWTLLTFAVIIPILWLLPGLLYLATRRIASACHATPAAAAPPEAPHKIDDESSAPVGPRSLRRRSSEMASAARLVAAEKADRALRARFGHGVLCGLHPPRPRLDAIHYFYSCHRPHGHRWSSWVLHDRRPVGHDDARPRAAPHRRHLHPPHYHLPRLRLCRLCSVSGLHGVKWW